jgi:transcription elongation factor Elf1
MEGCASIPHSVTCPHCGNAATLPEWSENVGEKTATHIWHCASCTNEFETRDDTVANVPSKAELAQQFLSNLVVE